MALIWIIYVGVNTAFEDLPEISGVRWETVSGASHMDVEESRDMTEVEDASVAQIDWLGEKLVFGNHFAGNGIPGSPESAPVRQRRDWLVCIYLWLDVEENLGLGYEMKS